MQNILVNENKKLTIKVDGVNYNRYAIKTHFIQPGEDYIAIIKKYVVPHYKKGDILSISEKIISLCQNRIIPKERMKPSLLAQFLSKFASKKRQQGVANPYKMQYAINKNGKIKVIYASICSGIGKLFGKHGIFYKIVGYEVAGLDGFCRSGIYIKEYKNFGIEIPENPDLVCAEIFNKHKIPNIIVDACDYDVELLGKSENVILSNNTLKKILKDNPAGNSHQLTPSILYELSHYILTR